MLCAAVTPTYAARRDVATRGVKGGQNASGLAAEAAPQLKMTDRLAAELPQMLAEHKQIVATLNTLIDAARAEGKPEFVHFAQKLMAHARAEEEVSYPTALLIGQYVKERLTALNATGS